MSDESKGSASSSGIGFGGALCVLFIGLKLTGYIDWSWWWVLSPLWIGLVVALAIVAIAAAVIGVLALLKR